VHLKQIFRDFHQASRTSAVEDYILNRASRTSAVEDYILKALINKT
jgi:hypothetical protein